ncbi:MAG: RNase adapter RapZ [Actinomycetota bacterium]
MSAASSDPAASSLSDLVVITGVSGAGKSTAMDVFEDAGYFCVDNLPPEMIASLVELFMHEGSKVEFAAIVCDVRGGGYFDGLMAALDDLEGSGVPARVVFLEADDQTLLTRYKETRRRHPLSPAGTVAAGIATERELVAPFKQRADLVIDTAGLTEVALRQRLAEEFLSQEHPTKLAITFMSFGHKNGPIREADLSFDVRFLPNPHYDADLRPLTGLDKKVVSYVARDGVLDEFYARLLPLLDYLLPKYLDEGKAHLVVAIGCTGGRHRSVAIAEHLGVNYGSSADYDVTVSHRDIDQASRA